MAITVGNSSTKNGLFDDGPSYTHSHNNNGDFLLVGLAQAYTGGTDIPNSVTYNGVSMTRIDTHASGTPNIYPRILSVWKLVNPASGANNVEISFASDPVAWYGVLTCLSLSGVDQTTPNGTITEASGTSTTVTCDVSSESGGLVIDFVAAGAGDVISSATVGSGQTQVSNLESIDSVVGNFGLCSYESGASTVTMSWSLDAVYGWQQTGVPVKAASTGGFPMYAYAQQ